VKLIQAMALPNADVRWKSDLPAKERELRGKGTTWRRVKIRRWRHKNYAGWVVWDEPVNGLLVAKVQSRNEDVEWQILNAFIGYLNRHFGEDIDSISISFRDS